VLRRCSEKSDQRFASGRRIEGTLGRKTFAPKAYMFEGVLWGFGGIECSPWP
jgi:hypothetical protein